MAAQALLLSPSLILGSFSMTSSSNLFVGTVLHLIKQLMEQLQSTFRTRFPLLEPPGRVAVHPEDGTRSISIPDEGHVVLGTDSLIIASAFSVLEDVRGNERKLMEKLDTKN